MGNLRFMPMKMDFFWVIAIFSIIVFVSLQKVESFEGLNVTEVYDAQAYGFFDKPLMVGLTLIPWAATKGAGIILLFICLF